MKRLKKIAKNQIQLDIKSIEEWVTGDHDSMDNDEIQGVINRNTDCLYSGEAYRLLEIYNYVSDIDINNNKEEYLKELRKKIKIYNKFQSFSKSYQWAKNYIENGDFGDIKSSIIIKSNIKGLDINKFISKYKDIISTMNTAINFYPEQEEIIAQFDNFEIIYVFGVEL